MITSVTVAFRRSSGSMLGTPFAMASLPVSPTEPDANARKMSRTESASTPSRGNGSGGTAAAGMSPVATRKMP